MMSAKSHSLGTKTYEDVTINTVSSNCTSSVTLLHQLFPSLVKKLRGKKYKTPDIQGKLSLLAGNPDFEGYSNSSIKTATFNCPFAIKFMRDKLWISDFENHIVRSIHLITKEVKLEIGKPLQEGFQSGTLSDCELRYPYSFGCGVNGDMYICNSSCICKVDAKTNQVTLFAGHETENGHKDGDNDKARFRSLKGILFVQTNIQSPPQLYACDKWNHCIRVIDIEKDKTTTFAGMEKGDKDGPSHESRFNCPHDIVKDTHHHHILYVSDSWNNKIKMVNIVNGMITTLVGDWSDPSILHYPKHMQMIDEYLFVACWEFKDCIVRVHTKSKEITKIHFKDGELIGNGCGIAYDPFDQSFYISDRCAIYKLQ